MSETSSRILEAVGPRGRDVVQRLQRLQEIGAALSAEQDLGRLLGLILREGRTLLGADSGSVFIREDEVVEKADATARDELTHVTPYLSLKVAQNDSVTFPFKEMKLSFNDQTVAGHVATRGLVVNVPDVYRLASDQPYSFSTAFDQVSGYRSKSMLVVPMKNRDGEIIGVLQLINKKRNPRVKLGSVSETETEVVAFDGVDEELAFSLASQAAVCIEKAKVYESIERMFEGLVMSFTRALEKRNRTTYGHCVRVARYALGIAEAVARRMPEKFGPGGLSEAVRKELRYAALLHDIGKIAVREAVLDKRNKLTDAQVEAISYRVYYWRERLRRENPDRAEKEGGRLDAWLADIRRINVPRGMSDLDRRTLEEIRSYRFVDIDGQEKPLLTPEEFENLSVRYGNLTATERKEIERHIVDTWEILKGIPWPRGLRHVAHIAATHHEKMNGAGYPWGLRGEEIPLGGRMLAIVDIYEALTAKDRPYKPPLPVEEALRIVKEEVDQGKLDPELYRLFVEEKVHGMFSDETGFVVGKKTP